MAAAGTAAAVFATLALVPHGGHAAPSLAAQYTLPTFVADAGTPVQDAHQAVAVQVHAVAVQQARAAARDARRQARAQAREQAARAAQRAAQVAPVAVAAPAAPPVASGGVLSPAQIGALWVAEGGSPAAEQTAICISEAESGGNTQAISPTDDFGIMQIHGDPAALNPEVGMRAAVQMSADGTSWGAWTTAASCGVS